MLIPAITGLIVIMLLHFFLYFSYLQTETFNSKEVLSEVGKREEILLDSLWKECITECTCHSADALETADNNQAFDSVRCPHKRSNGHPFVGAPQARCPNAKNCAPCRFVDSYKSCCQNSASKILICKAQLFSYRFILAEPIAMLLDKVERVCGFGSQKSKQIKAICYKILDCQESMLHSVRAVGRLVTICPEMAKLRIIKKTSFFWDTMRCISRAVVRQTSERTREHAVARIQLRLANKAKTISQVTALKKWFTFFTVGHDNRECTLFTSVFGESDVWGTCKKIFARVTEEEAVDEENGEQEENHEVRSGENDSDT